MYLYFQDWSRLSGMIDESIPHGKTLIKIYTSSEDPRSKFRHDMAIVQVKDDPFQVDEVFSYKNRGSYTGDQLELYLDSLNIVEGAKKRMRALFRFSNSDETQFCQSAMELRKGEDWLIDHPMGDIDTKHSKAQPEEDGASLHLDIFLEDSVKRLFTFIGYTNMEGEAVNEGRIMSWNEMMEWRRSQQPEGNKSAGEKEK